VNQVVSEDGSLLDAQGVDATHVTQDALADVVEVIQLDDVLPAGRFLVTPVPTNGNGRVVEVMNVVMRNTILTALKDDDAHRWRENATELMKVVVHDEVAKTQFEGLTAPRRLSQADAARADVVDFICHDTASLTPRSQLQRVPAEVSKDAVFNRAIHRAFGQDIAAHAQCGPTG